MLGRLDIRPAAVAWFLGATLLIGGGIRGFRAWFGPREVPQLIVQAPTSEAAALVDSIAEERRTRLHRPVAINSATAEEFERLPGIGPVLAKNIVVERERGGRFNSIDELTRVSGIGPKRLDALRQECILDTIVNESSGPVK